MKKFHNWSIVIGLCLLFFLVYSIGLNSLLHDLSLLGWGLFPLVLSEGVVDLFHTFGWRHCLSGPHRRLPFWRIFGIRMAGSSINYLTPTASLGGEVTKGALLAQYHQGPEAATAVIVGKLAYALAQLIFAAAGSILVLSTVDLPTGVWETVIGGSSLLGAGILGFLLVQKYGKLGSLVRWMVDRRIGGNPLKKAAEHLSEVDLALKTFYVEHPWDLSRAILWHMLGFFCGICQTWFFLWLSTGDASFSLAAGAWLLSAWLDLMSFAIPLDIGVQEASRILVFKGLGLGSALGLTYGIYLRIQQLFWTGVGMITYLGFMSEQRKREAYLRQEATSGDP